MKHSEEQIKEIAIWREDLVKQIGKHIQAIETLEKRLFVLDSMLKETSFTKASSLESTNIIPEETIVKEKKPIPITSGNDGKVIANAFVTPEQVEIILENDMGIAADVPPFKSFFIDRIIGEMKRKDTADADSGKIQKDSIIDYIINKNGSEIREIIIKNYKEKERVNEIINTASWSFTRMLENIKK
jgi:hypothetical protein